MTDVSVVDIKDLKEDLKEFLMRAQHRSHRQNMKKVKEYESKMVSETSVYNRVPLDGGAVLSIYEARDMTLDLIKRLMKLAMAQEVLITLRDYLKVCNNLEIRLQSLIYHIAYCPQYDLEIKDIRTKLESMQEIVTQLETEHKGDYATCNELLETCGVLRFDAGGGEADSDHEKEDDDDRKD